LTGANTPRHPGRSPLCSVLDKRTRSETITWVPRTPRIEGGVLPKWVAAGNWGGSGMLGHWLSSYVRVSGNGRIPPLRKDCSDLADWRRGEVNVKASIMGA